MGANPKMLDLEGGFHVGPLFLVITKTPKRLKRLSGMATWVKWRNAMPPWVDVVALRDVFRESKRMTEKTGIQHSVDHIVPIKNEIVCGLHVPWNLRVMTLEDNIKKGNRTWPDMPNEQIDLF